jgi:hypothetical protein
MKNHGSSLEHICRSKYESWESSNTAIYLVEKQKQLSDWSHVQKEV